MTMFNEIFKMIRRKSSNSHAISFAQSHLLNLHFLSLYDCCFVFARRNKKHFTSIKLRSIDIDSELNEVELVSSVEQFEILQSNDE